MKQVAQRYIHNRTKAISVDWYMTKRCNYDCSYCVDYLHDFHSPNPPLEKMKLLVDAIEDKYWYNVQWSLCGGEPMIIPWFYDIVEYIGRSMPDEISVVTNGSIPADKIIKNFEFLDNIVFSIHFEYIHNKIEETLEKIIAIEKWRREWNATHDKKKTFIARFMVYPGQLDLIERMWERLVEEDIEKIEFRNIRPQHGVTNELRPGQNELILGDNTGSVSTADKIKKKAERRSKGYDSEVFQQLIGRNSFYTQEEFDRINSWYKHKTDAKKRNNIERYWEDGSVTVDHYNTMTLNKDNNYKGWTCWAGVQHLKVDPDGRVFIGSCHRGGPIGNIYELDEGFELPTEPTVCDRTWCGDYLDLRVPKAAPGYEHLLKDYV